MSDADAPTLSDLIAPQLPYLRRYARALTGSQTSGDAYVAAVLEAIIADASCFERALPPRAALYRVFHAVFDSAAVTAPTEPTDPREAVARERLATLAPDSRRALLLSAVEGFSIEEVAGILGLGLDEAVALVEGAVAEIKRQTRARVLIIEDEPIIAMDIEGVVTDLDHDVVAIADTKDLAVDAAMTHRPDLILADIQLADGSSGIDAVQDILTAFSAPVIFITAFPERLLTGTRPEPTFLIAKPFRTETLQAAISQALFFRETATAG